MPKIADWVKETVSGTPGTGTITLAGQVTGFTRFADNFTTGDKVFYSISDGVNREEGIGTVTTGTLWTLSRDVVLKSLIAGTISTPTKVTLTANAVVGIAAISDYIGPVVGYGFADTASVITCNSSIPADDTIPQNTEGVEVITLAYTPKFSDSVLEIEAFAPGSNSSAGIIGAALFVDSTANAIKFAMPFSGGITAKVAASSTTSRTYKLRCGVTSGVFYVNGDSSGTRLGGGVSSAWIRVTEIRQ